VIGPGPAALERLCGAVATRESVVAPARDGMPLRTPGLAQLMQADQVAQSWSEFSTARFGAETGG